MRRKTIIGMCVLFIAGMFCACEDMLDIDSSRVQFEDDHDLNSPNDSLYSVWGILQKVQVVADRYHVLGEVRGDLVATTEGANADLKAIANFDFNSLSDDCTYANVKDYYAIINNCNYYLANADTSYITTSQEKPLLREFVAIKAIRAWTYMQMAVIYGSVPYYEESLTSMADIDKTLATAPRLDMIGLAGRLIPDLLLYKDIPYPSWKVPTSSGVNLRDVIVPIPVLLGDLYLWTNQYEAAAKSYYEQIVKEEYTLSMNWIDKLRYSNNQYISNYFFKDIFSTVGNRGDIVTIIPMELDAEKGLVSNIPLLWGYNASRLNIEGGLTDDNYEEIFLDPSLEPSMRSVELSNSQDNGEYANERFELFDKELGGGDARRHSTFAQYRINNEVYMLNFKFHLGSIFVYRKSHVYLRFAEAINRMGYSEYAFAILKYGLNYEVLNPDLSSTGDTLKAALVPFEYHPKDLSGIEMFPAFTNSSGFISGVSDDNYGVHSRGCFSYTSSGSEYVIPLWYYDPYTYKSEERLAEFNLTESSTAQDTLDAYTQIVEDMIVEELALETCWEGNRIGDLMRVSKRRGSTEFLAKTVAAREGEENKDNSLYNKLLNESNWYLPYK